MSRYTNDFRVQAKIPDQVTLTKNGEINFEDITYNRVNIEAILPDEYKFEGYKKVIGFVYGLDVRKPVVKIYAGSMRSACLNMCVFNPDAISIQEFVPDTPINYSFVGTCMSIQDDITKDLTELSNREYSKQECFKELGTWIDNCLNEHNCFTSMAGKVKLADSLPIEAYKNVFYNDKSPYYVEDNYTSAFNVYQSFTDLVSNGKSSDLFNRFEKTYLIKRIMNL